LIENPNYTVENLTEKIGVTKKTIERILSSLKDKGQIERLGPKRDGNWLVIK